MTAIMWENSYSTNEITQYILVPWLKLLIRQMRLLHKDIMAK
jgi:hypothetical protein